MMMRCVAGNKKNPKNIILGVESAPFLLFLTMAARAVAGVSDIQITAQSGQIVAPPPEGGGYLGFIFSRAAGSEAAEAALHAAHAELAFDIQADLPVTRACAQ